MDFARNAADASSHVRKASFHLQQISKHNRNALPRTTAPTQLPKTDPPTRSLRANCRLCASLCHSTAAHYISLLHLTA